MLFNSENGLIEAEVLKSSVIVGTGTPSKSRSLETEEILHGRVTPIFLSQAKRQLPAKNTYLMTAHKPLPRPSLRTILETTARLNAGFQRHLSKPYKLQELIETIADVAINKPPFSFIHLT